VGEPIALTPEERAAVRAYAVELIEAVRDDEELPSLRKGSTRSTDLVHLAVELHSLASERHHLDEEYTSQLAGQRQQIEHLERELAGERNAVIAALPTEAERAILRWIREQLESSVDTHDIRIAAARELIHRLLTMKVNHGA
jgi:hypothetical protein